MAKNDYRRQLIMLRGLEKGYSGHARLERRVTNGTIDIVVSAPDGEETLSAALIGPRGNALAIKTLGQLKNDGRGQRALLASFDPRNISGMDLNDVSIAVVTGIGRSGVRPVLSGFINGAKPVNWQEVGNLIRSVYLDTPPEAQREIPDPAPKEVFSASESAPVSEEGAQEGLPAPEAPPVPEEAPAESAAEPSQTQEDTGSGKGPAGAYLDIDMSKPWPGDIESLRLLFLTLPRYTPFPMEDYVFVRAGMAEETGIDHCAVGVKAENGRITGVCYALPMPYSAVPPAGLEEYEWVGSGTSGWWITRQSIEPYPDVQTE